MSIEFRCTHCDKLLSTQPGTEGQKAKCPQCGTVLVIPDASAAAAPDDVNPFDAPPPREPDFASSAETPPPRQPGFETPPQPSDNPYQSTAAYSTYATDTPIPRSFNPTQIDLGEMLSKTWRIYTNNLGALIVGSLVANLGGNVASTITWAIGAALINNAGALTVPVVLLEIAAIALVSAFFLIGLMKFMLTIARGEPANFGDLISAGPLVVPGAGVLALLIAGTVGGAVFCLVPGIIFLLIFSQSLFMLLDQRTGVLDSFKYSAAAMKGNVLTFFLLMAVVCVVMSLFILLTCGIGALFATPFVSLLYAVVYLSVTGQPTAEDRAALHDTQRPFDSPGMQPT